MGHDTSTLPHRLEAAAPHPGGARVRRVCCWERGAPAAEIAGCAPPAVVHGRPTEVEESDRCLNYLTIIPGPRHAAAQQLQVGYARRTLMRAGGPACCWGSNGDGRMGAGRPVGGRLISCGHLSLRTHTCPSSAGGASELCHGPAAPALQPLHLAASLPASSRGAAPQRGSLCGAGVQHGGRLAAGHAGSLGSWGSGARPAHSTAGASSGEAAARQRARPAATRAWSTTQGWPPSRRAARTWWQRWGGAMRH